MIEIINLSKKYKIEAVSEMPKNTITITLNQAPTEKLTLENFSFICPSDSELTLTGAELKVSKIEKYIKLLSQKITSIRITNILLKLLLVMVQLLKNHFR